MSLIKLERYLKKIKIPFKKGEFMSFHTTLRVGGPCDYYVEVEKKVDLENLYRFCICENIPVFILGGGSNILVGDKGIRGLVIKNRALGYKITQRKKVSIKKTDTPRKQETHWKKGFLEFRDIDYIEKTTNGVVLEVNSGTNLSYLITKSLADGFCGLQWFAGIPGTVGGAIWNNIHGADWFFGDFLETVRFIDSTGSAKTLSKKNLGLKYNKSFFQDNSKLILSAVLNLIVGDTKKAKFTAEEWKKRKRIQPRNSAGSTFSNISEKEAKKAGLENLSAGYIIDVVLNLKGVKVGKAQVSSTHANFIETFPGAKASDVISLCTMLKQKAKEKLGITLNEEIIRIGEF